VFNDDIIAPGKGFGAHPHENAEIVTIVLSGALRHEDSQGNKDILRPGEVQRMSAGSGIWHSEHNASQEEKLHLLQIWLTPKKINIAPSYEQKAVALGENKLVSVVSSDKKRGTIFINQDAEFFVGRFSKKTYIEHVMGKNTSVYFFVIEGTVLVNGKKLLKGDAAEVTDEKNIIIAAEKKSGVLMIEIEE